MARDSGASTLTPQKMVGSVVNQATSDASGGMGGIVPLDLSNGGNKDESSREASREEDPAGKNLRREPEALRERVGVGARTRDHGAST